eukprot:PhM_4_TR2665/c0_g1_i1/m.71722
MAWRDTDSVLSAMFARRSCGTTVTSMSSMRDSLCGECEEMVATWDCRDCQENYCDDCLTAVHQRGRRKEHSNFVPIHVCGACARSAATKECKDCSQFFCEQCCAQVHAPGKLKHLYIRPIGAAATDEENPNVSNGYGIVVTRLSFGSIHPKDVTEEMSDLQTWCDVMAEGCRQGSKSFIDAEPMTLDFPPVPTALPGSVIADLTHKQLEKANAWLRAMAQTQEAHQAYLTPLLEQVFSWRRLSRIFTSPSLFDVGNAQLAAKPLDITGHEHDINTLMVMMDSPIFDIRWLNTALCMVGMNRNTLMHLFVSAEYEDVGLYVLQFYRAPGDLLGREPGWKLIVIDDNIPCDVGNNPVFGQTDARGEIWAMVVLKAYSKFLGALSFLHRGSLAIALTHMCNATSTMLSWPHPDDVKKADELTHVWWLLSESTRLGLMTALFPRSHDGEEGYKYTKAEIEYTDPTTIEDEAAWERTDVMVHTSELTSAEANELAVARADPTAPLRLVKIRTVCGDLDWEGDWSQDSATWTKRVRDRFNYKMFDDSITWMSLDDLHKYYTACLVSFRYVGSPIATLHHFEVRDTPEDCLPNGVQILLKFGSDYHSNTASVSIYVTQPYAGSVGESVRPVEIKAYALAPGTVKERVRSVAAIPGEELRLQPKRVPKQKSSAFAAAASPKANTSAMHMNQQLVHFVHPRPGSGVDVLVTVSQQWERDAFTALVAIFDDNDIDRGPHMNPFLHSGPVDEEDPLTVPTTPSSQMGSAVAATSALSPTDITPVYL